ncbi:MAG: zinc transporter ZitB [Methanomethylovorans sp. PtaU1.Bin073]|nr:MAG: zinc transporter ZitB [Methanomethylovorans sp. PtaU1.Bin073]
MAHEHNHTEKMGWTIFLNIVITVAEYIGGIYSGSLALLSDAGHNFSDVLSLILGYYGEKVSEKQATKTHTFGFKRFEIFTALINALALVAVAFYILFEAFQRLHEPRNISLGLMLGVGSIGLLGNLISIFVLNKEKNASINMKAAYLHLFYDTVSSAFVMISAVIIYFTNYVFIDTIVSVIIAFMILYSSLDIIKNSIHIFMQGVPEGTEFDEVYSLINDVKGVKSVHNLHIWAINSNNTFLSCHVCIDKTVEKRTDEVIQTINKLLKEKYEIEHTAIQIEENNICKTGIVCSK